jgi:hypothetical protein
MPISKNSRDPEDRYIINYINRNYPSLKGGVIHPGILGNFYCLIVVDQTGIYHHKISIKIPARFKRRRQHLAS